MRACALLAAAALLSGCETLIPAFRLPDAGEADAGFDAGIDAGVDAGIDAGPPVDTLSAGFHATVVDRAGVVVSFGTGGSASEATSGTPRQVAALHLTQVGTGTNAWCGLDGSGQVWCRGHNEYGQLASGNFDPRLDAGVVGLGGPARAVAITHDHACALVGTTVRCWGRNLEGQLGQDDTNPGTDRPTPVTVPGSYVQVAAGDGHTCALGLDAGIWCWGRNTAGELGIGDVVPQQLRKPNQVPGVPGFSSIRVSMFATCGLDGSGGIWCWGGKLEDPTQPSPTPARFETTGGWTDFELGAFMLCARKSDASLWCQGRNNEGQLGLGDETPRTGLVQVATEVSAYSLGRFHTCLVTKGELRCAGANDEGQLGLGDTTNRNTFQRVTLP
ncbi:MAG: hypothetical protein K1X89_31415 [Myxococcaceae bacterium]|nr:hypothetical protein [Myxococcaceae bacterium]